MPRPAQARRQALSWQDLGKGRGRGGRVEGQGEVVEGRESGIGSALYFRGYTQHKNDHILAPDTDQTTHATYRLPGSYVFTWRKVLVQVPKDTITYRASTIDVVHTQAHTHVAHTEPLP